MKKIVLLAFLLILSMPDFSYAYKKVNVNATIKELELKNEDKQIVYLEVENDAELKNAAYLPKNAILKAEVDSIQKEKRWHKNAFAVLKILSFTPAKSDTVIDLSEDNIYLSATKYVPVDFPEVATTGIELGATTAASFFLPGADIVYYFTKGALLREDDSNWFKSGVSEAYDNSLLWFIEKGRKIKLEEECTVNLKTIADKKLTKLIKD